MDIKTALEKVEAANPGAHTLVRSDGRIEIICEHGVGHTVFSPGNRDYIHGCCGCCKDYVVVEDEN